jgi:tRNA-specific 2-thiouridylase
LTAPSLEPAEVLEKYFLLRSPDPAKDQSYFLWTLNQKQLSKIIFPIGHLKKTEVRKLAKKFKLPVAEKKDSQGICFLGAVDLKEFLKHYIKEKKGEVILVPSEVEGDKKNNVIGWHNGAVFHTLGERHGFVVKKKSANDKAYYVVSKNVKRNILFVSQNKNASLIHANKRIVLKNTNWVSGQNPTFNFPLSTFNLTCQIRYHGELLPCQVKITGKTKAKIIFQKPVLVASGQSCVIYDKNICLGGGVVI